MPIHCIIHCYYAHRDPDNLQFGHPMIYSSTKTVFLLRNKHCFGTERLWNQRETKAPTQRKARPVVWRRHHQRWFVSVDFDRNGARSRSDSPICLGFCRGACRRFDHFPISWFGSWSPTACRRLSTRACCRFDKAKRNVSMCKQNWRSRLGLGRRECTAGRPRENQRRNGNSFPPFFSPFSDDRFPGKMLLGEKSSSFESCDLWNTGKEEKKERETADSWRPGNDSVKLKTL